MVDFQNYSLTHLGSANVNVPRIRIEGVVTDSQTGAVIADFTGASAPVFPAVMSTLTVEQRHEFAELISTWLLCTKAGL